MPGHQIPPKERNQLLSLDRLRPGQKPRPMGQKSQDCLRVPCGGTAPPGPDRHLAWTAAGRPGPGASGRGNSRGGERPEAPAGTSAWGVEGEQVPAPDYFRHTGGGIVYHHSQLVHKDAVGPADQEVTAVPGQVFYVEALDPILDGNFPVWHPDPPGGARPKAACSAGLRSRHRPSYT